MKKEKYQPVRRCAECEHASILADSNLLCRYAGVVPPEYVCRRFRYDLLKRVPKPLPKIEPPSPEELILDEN